MASLKDVLLYAGADKQSYLGIKDTILEGNRKNLFAFSMISAIGMAIMVVFSFLEPSLEKNRLAYILTCVLMGLDMVISAFPAKKHKGLVYFAQYLFIAVLMGFGIDLGTFIEPNEVTVSFAILMFAVPLLFTDAPWRMILVITASVVMYIVAALYTQTPTYFTYNMSNIVPYGIISLIVSTYLMSIKVSRHILEERNRFLSESDPLTGLMNRNCYEQQIKRLRENKHDILTVGAFDVNGLKLVNDRLGHHAGDELIMGAAQCISAVFKPYGNVYRVGGDEFMVIIEGQTPSSDDLWTSLERHTLRWKGTHVSSLTLCMGIAVGQPDESIDEIIKKADKIMYSYKEAYYQKSDSKERRI